MRFADYYFMRFESDAPQIPDKPADDLHTICVIPAYNEPQLLNTLKSLKEADEPKFSAEIIVVINHTETSPEAHKIQNEKTYRDALKFSTEFNGKIRCRVLFYKDFPKKHAGVGLARKKGMDEALHRFNSLNKSSGLISCTDADCLVEKNYFSALEAHFIRYPDTHGVTIHYEHLLEDPALIANDRERIISYELHLRYLNQALRYINFPHAFQTIGSSFAVRAESYAKQGGMNKKKAGEDFYFLQKIISSGNFYDLPQTCVYPSARGSTRVPFGTGAAMNQMREQDSKQYETYQLESFLEIKEFIDRRRSFMNAAINFSNFQSCTKHFLEDEKFAKDLEHIKHISTNETIFDKHFFSKFNAFKMVKYLNFARRNYYKAGHTRNEAQKLLALIGLSVPDSDEDLLTAYRQHERTNPKNN